MAAVGYGASPEAPLAVLHDLYVHGGVIVGREGVTSVLKDAYCSSCFKEFTAEQFGKFHHRCPNCYQCHDCGHTLRIVRHRGGPYVYHCSHCHWETNEASSPEELRAEWHRRSLARGDHEREDVDDRRGRSLSSAEADRNSLQQKAAAAALHCQLLGENPPQVPEPPSFDSFLCSQGKALTPSAQMKSAALQALRGGFRCESESDAVLRRCPLIPRYKLSTSDTAVWDQAPVSVVRAPADRKGRSYGRDVLSQEIEEVSACATRWLPSLACPLQRRLGDGSLEMILLLTSPHELRAVTIDTLRIVRCWGGTVLTPELSAEKLLLSGRKEGVASSSLRHVTPDDWDMFEGVPLVVSGHCCGWSLRIQPTASRVAVCFRVVAAVHDGPVVEYYATATMSV